MDSMKRQMNLLHWPYNSFVILENWRQISPVIESLTISECFDGHAFAAKSLEAMEPGRKLRDIRIIFSDCFVTDDFLELTGMSRATGMYLIWDAHHLRSDAWPKKFGQTICNTIKTPSAKMLFGDRRAASCEEACTEAATLLATNPALLDYVTDHCDHPERFATCFIHLIVGSLRREGSQPAESNHSSVHAHLGVGSQEMEGQIQELHVRISDLQKKHMQANSIYHHQCIVAASEHEVLHPDQDPCQSLHKEACINIWTSNVLESLCHDCMWLLDYDTTSFNDASGWTPTFSCKILRKGWPKETARYLSAKDNCVCSSRASMLASCPHEVARDKCVS
jgi:hypothetical protein